jgi:uncharacterized repeat protein (TIGR03803 family)
MSARERSLLGKGNGPAQSGRRRILNAAVRESIHSNYQAEALERRVLLSGLTTVASFNPWVLGAFPAGRLVEDSAGNLYGTTLQAGPYGGGTVYEWNKATNEVSVIAAFNDTNGDSPSGGVVFDSNGNLYGTTYGGGANGDGTVFEIVAGSNTITTLASFNGIDGSHPVGNVVLDAAGDLFTATSLGGSPSGNQDGTVVEIVKGSGAITVLGVFNGPNGNQSFGNLARDGEGNIFGTTVGGGPGNAGVVFEIPNGKNTVQTFATFNSVGLSGPVGVIVDATGNLFGTTGGGGTVQQGTLYEIAAGTNSITVLASFNSPFGYASPSDTPVMDSAGDFFGAVTGSGNEYGYLYELPKESSTITYLGAFTPANGGYPEGLIIDSSGNLYGTSGSGGTSGYLQYGSGTIFEISHGANSVTYLSSFATNGAYGAYSGVIADSSGNLYGLSEFGGANGTGAVYEVPAGTNSVITLASVPPESPGFWSPGPWSPAGLAMDSGGNLYGTTQAGGIDGDGTVFELLKGSNTLTTLATFNGANGNEPFGTVVSDGSGDIFGTAYYGGTNGVSGYGTVWEIFKGSNTIADLATFNNTIGELHPEGDIAIDSSGDLYGTTEFGGVNQDGAIYELINGSNAITTLASFNGSNGETPVGGVVIDGDGNLYGTTSAGGTYNDGTAFQLINGANTITSLACFNGANGAVPYGTVIVDAAGNVFGTTSSGGDNNYGTVFEIENGTGAITTLQSLDYFSGSLPYCMLTVDAGGDLFGTTTKYAVGNVNVGAVFELPSAATVAPPAVSSFALNSGAAQRSMVTQATVVFTEPVSDPTNAVSVLQAATGGGPPTPMSFAISSPDGGTTWNLTFPSYAGGSLPDGIYDLTITATNVSDLYTGQFMTGGNQTFTFDRLFGDADGNGIVNNADYFQFKKTYGQATGSANYNPVFDYDANGIVNNADYFQFKKRYGQSIIIAAQPVESPAVALLNSSDSASNDKVNGLLL